MTIDTAHLEAHFRGALGVPVFLEASTGEDAPEGLTEGERRTLAGFGDTHRAASWLRGRKALRALLARLAACGAAPPDAESRDTTLLRFPHPMLSLTHTGDWAIAAGTLPEAAAGIGVDLELRAHMREGAERFFLGTEETRWLLALAPLDRDRERVRLWTVKEALFKANPGNEGTLLGHYLLDEPGARKGLARWKAETTAGFVYASVLLAPGAVSLAVRPRAIPT